MATHPRTPKLLLTVGLLLFALSVGCLLLFGLLGFVGWQEALWVIVVGAIMIIYLVAAIDIIWMRIVEKGFHLGLVRTMLPLFVGIPIVGLAVLAAGYFWIDRTGYYDTRSLPYRVVTTVGMIGAGSMMLGVHYLLIRPRADDDNSRVHR